MYDLETLKRLNAEFEARELANRRKTEPAQPLDLNTPAHKALVDVLADRLYERLFG